MRTTIVITILVFCYGGLAWGDSDTERLRPSSERGWFFYLERYPEEPQAEPEPEPAADVVAEAQTDTMTEQTVSVASGPAPLSAEWLKENLPRYLNQAIDNPSRENVLAYAYLQKHAMNKASSFREAYQAAVYSDPYLDENNVRPIASAAASLNDRLADEAGLEVLRELAKTTGIWFFYTSDCPYCAKQAPVLEILSRKYGFIVTAISLDGLPLPGGQFPDFKTDQGQAAVLKVATTPTIMLARPPNDYLLIANGIIAASEFAERTLTLARQAGWIDEDSFDQTRKLRYAKTGDESLQPLQKLYGKDFEPEADDIVNYFKQRIVSGT